MRPFSYEPYEPNEPTFDDEDDEAGDLGEPEEPTVSSATAANSSAHAHGGPATAEGRDVVEVGEVGAPAAKKSGKKGTMTEKKVAPEQRSTTPYMTKYERARVLGTRALQIRYGGSLYTMRVGGAEAKIDTIGGC